MSSIVCIADDFSGAAEIAGIGKRFSLNAEVQLQFDQVTSAQLIVINADTRSLSKEQARDKMAVIARQLKTTHFNRRLFQKVDSAMRGHLVVEIGALCAGLNLNRALLLPANPSKERKIIDGQYFVNGTLLSESVFQYDPVFPAVSSNVTKILQSAKVHSHLPATNQPATNAMPITGIITSDLANQNDFDNLISQTTEKDLICGAADCFESFLRFLGIEENKTINSEPVRSNTLIVNGSTVIQQNERAVLNSNAVPIIPMPGCWQGNVFKVSTGEINEWQNVIVEHLSTSNVVSLVIDQPILDNTNTSSKSDLKFTDKFTDIFAALIKKLSVTINLAELNIALTGGATAAAIINTLGINRLDVIEEISPGVVRLQAKDKPWQFTVKPGSYAWPKSLLSPMNSLPILAISTGDPAGIGPEITVKALSLSETYQYCKPLVICDGWIMEQIVKLCDIQLKINCITEPNQGLYQYGTIDVLDMHNIDRELFQFNTVAEMTGKASYEYVAKVIELAQAGTVDATITGPIHKEAIAKAGFKYAGHTEIYAEHTNTKDYTMMLAEGNFRVVHVSTHVSLLTAIQNVTKDRVLKVIRLANNALKEMGFEKPRIAVAGLNPHAGENGLFGNEEIDDIIPAIKTAKNEGIDASGPYPPDTIFPIMKGGQYDIVVCMYHDQGHIPTKLLGFNYDHEKQIWQGMSGVNITLGLPIIRVSVDHGVAFDKGGKGEANPESMIQALQYGAQFCAAKLANRG